MDECSHKQISFVSLLSVTGPKKVMTSTFIFVLFAVLVKYDFASAQEVNVPESLTAAELWNPSTWFYPFAIATAEGYKDYYIKAQKATNELYKQIYSTNAFPWITGNWDFLNPNKPNQNGQNGQDKPKPEEPKPEENKPQEGENQPKPEENKPQGGENQPKPEEKPQEGENQPKPEEKPQEEENQPKPEENKPQGGDVNAQVQGENGGAQVQGNVEEGTADAQVDDGKPEDEAAE